jgi:hypothetical protein
MYFSYLNYFLIFGERRRYISPSADLFFNIQQGSVYMYCTHTPRRLYFCLYVLKKWPRFFSFSANFYVSLSCRIYCGPGISRVTGNISHSVYIYILSARFTKDIFLVTGNKSTSFFLICISRVTGNTYSTSQYIPLWYIFYFACKIKQMTKILLWRPADPRDYCISYPARCSKGFLKNYFGIR